MYIGPQGIVHGTFNTLLNAGRLKLGVPDDGDLTGKLFISSGLGGMSGAQGKQLKSQKRLPSLQKWTALESKLVTLKAGLAK